MVHTQNFGDSSRGAGRPFSLRPGEGDVYIWGLRAAGESSSLFAVGLAVANMETFNSCPLLLSRLTASPMTSTSWTPPPWFGR